MPSLSSAHFAQYLVAIAVTVAGLACLRASRGLLLVDATAFAERYLASRVAYIVLVGLVWWLVAGAWVVTIAVLVTQGAITAVVFAALRRGSRQRTSAS